MISLKSAQDIEGLKVCGALSKEVLRRAGEMAKPGVSTLEIDRFVEDFSARTVASPASRATAAFPHRYARQ